MRKASFPFLLLLLLSPIPSAKGSGFDQFTIKFADMFGGKVGPVQKDAPWSIMVGDKTFDQYPGLKFYVEKNRRHGLCLHISGT